MEGGKGNEAVDGDGKGEGGREEEWEGEGRGDGRGRGDGKGKGRRSVPANKNLRLHPCLHHQKHRNLQHENLPFTEPNILSTKYAGFEHG